MTKFGYISLPTFRINKDDSKHLTKIQVKKVQFLFENDYFIWNEAEMYLRYHDIFTSLPNSDILYDNLCRTTRVVFNLIHDTHFSGTGSNAAHLKYFEVLDAWGALSEYIKLNNAFPQPFIDWFDTIFQIYMEKDDSGERAVQCENFLRLYLKAGLGEEDAIRAFSQISSKKKLKITFDYLIFLLKQIITSSEPENISYLIVPNLQATLLTDKIEKPPDQVFRNYYDYKQVYFSNTKLKQCDWDKFEQQNNELNKKINENNKNLTNLANQSIKNEFKLVNKNDNNVSINNSHNCSNNNNSHQVSHHQPTQPQLLINKNEIKIPIQQATKAEVKVINQSINYPPQPLKNQNNLVSKTSNNSTSTTPTPIPNNSNSSNNLQASLSTYYKLNADQSVVSPLPPVPLNTTTSTTTTTTTTTTSSNVSNASQTNTPTSTINTINNVNSTANSSVDNIENFYKIKNIPNNANIIKPNEKDLFAETNQTFDYFKQTTSEKQTETQSKNIKLEVLSESSSNYNKNSDSSELFEETLANKNYPNHDENSRNNNNNNNNNNNTKKLPNIIIKKQPSMFQFKGQSNELNMPMTSSSTRRDPAYSKFRSKSELGSRNSSFNNSEFKLSEFRREFKTSNIELSQNLSKSINTLDYLSKISNNQNSNMVPATTVNNNKVDFQREKYMLTSQKKISLPSTNIQNRSTSSSKKSNLKQIKKDSSIYSDLVNTSESESLRQRSSRNSKLKKLKTNTATTDSLLKSDKPQLIELKFNKNTTSGKKNSKDFNWNDLKKKILIKKLIGSDESELNDENDYEDDVNNHYHYHHRQLQQNQRQLQQHLNENNSSENQFEDESNENEEEDEDEDEEEVNEEEEENDSDDDDDTDESIHLYSGSLSEKFKKMTMNPTRQDNRENILSKNKIFSSSSMSSSCNSLCSNESIKKIYTDHSSKGGGLLVNRSIPHSNSVSKIYPATTDDLSKSSNIKIKSLPLNHPTSFKLNDDPYLRLSQISKSSNYRNLVIKKPGSQTSSSSTNHLQYISNSKLIKTATNESSLNTTTNQAAKLVSEDIGDASSASYLVSSIVHNNNSANYSLASSKQMNSRQQQLMKLKKKQHHQMHQIKQSNTNIIATTNNNAASTLIDEEETKSENYVNKPIKSKNDRSHGLSEPIKSILDAIVSLSSLDTLNDIDSDDDDNDEDEDDDDDDDDDSNIYLQHHHHLHHHHHMHESHQSSNAKQKLVEPSDSTLDLNYVDHHLYRYEPNEFYTNSANLNTTNNEANKILIDQDWSYSLNSTGFSSNEHRLIAEIVRKLKPIINKCVKKEIKSYIEQINHMNINTTNNNSNNNSINNTSSTTNQTSSNSSSNNTNTSSIKDTSKPRMEKTSLTNIGDF